MFLILWLITKTSHRCNLWHTTHRLSVKNTYIVYPWHLRNTQFPSSNSAKYNIIVLYLHYISIYHTSWITSVPKNYFISDNDYTDIWSGMELKMVKISPSDVHSRISRTSEGTCSTARVSFLQLVFFFVLKQCCKTLDHLLPFQCLTVYGWCRQIA